MALVAVLWIVAALSIMVTGLSYVVRQQIQVAATLRDQASGQAVGEAAVALVLQQMLASNTRPVASAATTVEYGGVQVDVEAAPLSGWISLNTADAPLLAALLQIAGGLNPPQAQQLAAAIVEWRSTAPPVDPTSAGGVLQQPRLFESVEDLLLLPGVDYPLYARIAPLLSADLISGNPQVDPRAAPPEVLAVLAQGNLGRVAQYVAQRTSDPLADASGFSNAAAAAGGGSSRVYRMRARVPLDAGKILLLTRDVALGSAYSTTAPWRVLRTDRQIVAPAAASSAG
ncbi:MAG: general secretion pathway protein GspK [Burkholderiaceae bacterium]|jgi:general secretion pathway protein K|nr:general secretion pathway protein GspK [Burkholderiaceae bacterium]